MFWKLVPSSPHNYVKIMGGRLRRMYVNPSSLPTLHTIIHMSVFFNMAQQSPIDFDNYLAYSNKHPLDLPNLNDVGIFLLRKLPRQIWMDSLVTLHKMLIGLILPKECKT